MYILTALTNDAFFNQTKVWFLNQWSKRIDAKLLLCTHIDINVLLGLTNESIFFFPKWSIPNLGAPNPKNLLKPAMCALTSAVIKDSSSTPKIASNSQNQFFINLMDTTTVNVKDTLLYDENHASKTNEPFYIRYDLLKEIMANRTIMDIHDIYDDLNKYKNNKNSVLLDESWNYIYRCQISELFDISSIYIFNLSDISNKQQALTYITNQLYNWVYLNSLRFRNVEDFANIFNFTGRNKLGCKEIAKSLGITVPKTYQVVDEIKEIKWTSLPKAYVIKPTNLDGSRKVYVVRNGINMITMKKIKVKDIIKDYRNYRTKQMDKELNKYLQRVLVPKIIIEEYISDSNGEKKDAQFRNIPIDYKCYVFRGSLAFILVIDGESDRRRFAFYDREWVRIPNVRFSTNTEPLIRPIPKPKFLKKLVTNAETLGQAFQRAMKGCWEGDCIRIDFYINSKDVYFGEFAIFPNGGRGKNVNSEGLFRLAELWLGSDFINA